MGHGLRLLRLGALLPALLPPLRAQEPPPLTNGRADEDYAYLADPERRSGAWWEPLAFVPFSSDGRAWLGTGLEVRVRHEAYQNDAWSPTPEADHDYLWWRALPHVSWNRPGGRLFAQLLLARETGDEAGPSALDENRADLLQGFAQLGRARDALELRAGRQLLSYGSERLIGPRYGPNVPQAFDAARLASVRGRWRLDALYGRPVETRTGTFDDRGDDTRALWMLYASRVPAAGEPLGLDLYALGLHDEDAVFEAGAGEERRATLGSRLFGAARGWDWNFELFGQLGTFAGDEIRAWSLASDSGYALTLGALPARLGLRADLISGDDSAGDDRLGTFNPLFPKGKYFGESGLLGPTNLIDLHPSLTLELERGWSLELGTVLFWRESTGDGLYDNGGNLLRASGGSAERFTGTQLDLTLAWQVDRHLDLSLAGSYFAAGAFLEDTGPSEDVAFVSVELRFRY